MSFRLLLVSFIIQLKKIDAHFICKIIFYSNIQCKKDKMFEVSHEIIHIFLIIVNRNQVDSEAATIPMKCNYYLHKVSIIRTGKPI